MFVVLDTNVLFGQWSLDGPELKLLFTISTIDDDITVCVPNVVIEEIKGKYLEKLKEVLPSVETAIANLQAIGVHTALAPALESIETYYQAYSNTLTSKLRAAGVWLLPYPSVSHEVIVKRLQAGRKPFGRSEKEVGYRDALIWESILALSDDKGDKIILVSDNHTDFADPTDKTKLHQQLLDDLHERGSDPALVTRVPSLQQFNNNFIRPILPEVVVADEVLEDIIERFNLDGQITSLLPASLSTLDVTRFPLQSFKEPEFLKELESPHLGGVGEIESVQVDDLRFLSSEEITGRAQGIAEIQVYGFMDKSEWYGLADEEKNYIYDYDDEWNDYTVHVTVLFALHVSISFTLNISETKITGMEYEPVKLEPKEY